MLTINIPFKLVLIIREIHSINVKMPAKGTLPNFLVFGGGFFSQKHRGTPPVFLNTTLFKGPQISIETKTISMIIHHPYLIEKNVDNRVWVSKFGLVANLVDN